MDGRYLFICSQYMEHPAPWTHIDWQADLQLQIGFKFKFFLMQPICLPILYTQYVKRNPCMTVCQFSVPYAQPCFSAHLNQIWHVVSLHPKDN